MEFTMVEEKGRSHRIVVDPRRCGQSDRYYYFVSKTLPEYRPLVYGVASRPFSALIIESLKSLFNLS